MAFNPSSVSINFGFADGYQTSLSGAMTDSQTTCELTVLPTPDEGTLVIEPETDNEEEIYYTSKGSGLVNIPSVSAGRGVNGTAKAHNSGVAVKMLVTKASMDSTKYLGAMMTPGLDTIRYYTATDTWSKPAGLAFITVEVQGGGGGGGAATSDVTMGGSGAAGGYSKKKIATADLGTTEAVTVGALGAGSASSDGAAGTASSFGIHAVGNGGAGGGANGGTSVAGGTGTSGDMNIVGQGGAFGGASVFSDGGSSQLGRGGIGGELGGIGFAASGYGAGGGGGHRNSANNKGGGAGTAGIVIVTEYLSI